MLIGGEGPNIESHSVTHRKPVSQFKAHEKRVKAAAITKLNASEELHLITASNDGFIKLWRIPVRANKCSSVQWKENNCFIFYLGNIWRTMFSDPSGLDLSHHVPVCMDRKKPELVSAEGCKAA